MRKKKGFTLMELTIVLAIIAILIAIVLPSWGYYLQRSRLKAQNAKAKVIFNAAQTVITDLEFYERHTLADYNNATSETKSIAANRLFTNVLNAGTDNEWYFYWDGAKGFLCDVNGTAVTAASFVAPDATPSSIKETTINTWNAKISRAVDKIAKSDEVFRIYVKDYTVMSVATARTNTDRFIGSHPITLDMRRSDGVDSRDDVKNKRAGGIMGLDMKELDIPDYEAEKAGS